MSGKLTAEERSNYEDQAEGAMRVAGGDIENVATQRAKYFLRLWEVIDTRIATLQAEQPYGVYSINNNQTRENLVDAILSVIPPPRDEMFQSAIAVYESRIRELETEVERLKAMTYLPSNEAIDKAAKYDALRERFPFWPGEEFYAVDGNVISKHAVRAVYFDHVATQNGFPYGHNQCHPTADACKAAIPVEE